MQKYKPKRILLDNTPEFHAEIKSRAAARGVTIKAYVIRAIIEQIKRDQQYE